MPQILVVEDNLADVYLIREALAVSEIRANLHIANDGEQAIRFLDAAVNDETAPCPSLVILDINLPKKHGIEVLKHLREKSRCRDAVVIMVSTSGTARDRTEAQNAGANEYFCKPSEYEAFMKLGELIRRLWPAGGRGRVE